MEKIYNCPRRLFETLQYDEQKYFKLPIKIVFFLFFGSHLIYALLKPVKKKKRDDTNFFDPGSVPLIEIACSILDASGLKGVIMNERENLPEYTKQDANICLSENTDK